MKAEFCDRGHHLEQGNRAKDGRCLICRREYMKAYMRARRQEKARQRGARALQGAS